MQVNRVQGVARADEMTIVLLRRLVA